MKTIQHECMLPKQPRCLDLPPTAGCCAKLICTLRSLLLPCDWHHGTMFHIRSRKNLALEKEKQLTKAHAFVWHPYSAIKFYWDCLGLVVYLCVLFYMPFQVFFNCKNRYDAFVLFSDAFAAFDICTRFITGYNDKDSKAVILHLGDIAKRYVKGSFTLDLIAALPLQIYQPFKKCTHTIWFILKLPRLMTLKEKWKNAYEQVELSYLTTAAIGVVVRVLLFFHWMTYIHYQVPVFCSQLSENEYVWSNRSRSFNITNDFHRYTTNLYWVVGLCIGAGYYRPVEEILIYDLVLTSVISLVGLIFIIFTFATVFRLFIYENTDHFIFNGKLKDLKEYMGLQRLPNILQRKILLFINYKFNGSYFNEEYILNTINEQIKQDINMHCCKALVTRIPMFQDMPVAFVNTIIFSLVEVMFMPGEVVVSQGEPIDCLYIISSGSVTVMDSNGKEITHLRDGAHFGDDALFEPTKIRKTTIIALEITETYKLSNEAFRGCVRPYPQIDARVRRSVQFSNSKLRLRRMTID
ncbi:unnamed protein product [Pieris macdunnoughi]|uniref:Cyclic nucleotide-binding domain-containing protein n=1 Tax=Pieris macdunnoughi TaxID=345717 RepID=A0A821SMX5_9NEOP|nr:unnamed protein product [Pieris macdunnoughi]